MRPSAEVSISSLGSCRAKKTVMANMIPKLRSALSTIHSGTFLRSVKFTFPSYPQSGKRCIRLLSLGKLPFGEELVGEALVKLPVFHHEKGLGFFPHILHLSGIGPPEGPSYE